jgi:YVTN family beta-propeller protein
MHRECHLTLEVPAGHTRTQHTPGSTRTSFRHIASGLLAVIVVLAVGFEVSASPAMAAPQAKQLAGKGSIWVTNDGGGGNPVQVIKGKKVTDIEPFNDPTGIAFTPDGDFAYVANTDASNVEVISTHTLTVTATITLPVLQSGSPAPTVIVMSPDGTTAYVVDGAFVDVISTATNAVTTDFPVGGGINGMAITPNGLNLYITWLHGATADVAVADTSTDMVTDDIAVGGNPQGIAVTPNGETAYVSNCSSDTVCLIDTATTTETGTINVGGGSGGGLAISPNGKTVAVVGNPNNGDLVEIATKNNKVSQPISGLSGPSGTSNVVFDGNSTVLVANSGGLTAGLAVVKGKKVTYPYNANLGGDHFLAGVAVEP